MIERAVPAPKGGILSARGIVIIRSGWLERAAYIAGFACLAAWAAATIHGRAFARSAVEAFEAEAPVDQSSWSAERISAYASSRAQAEARPLAVLRIPRLKMAVPILEGVEAPVLDRGAGHIPETALPGEAGNIGIAGHRDGFFRGLKDVRPGDEIELATHDGREVYVVERTWIVEPEDLSVLEPTAAPSVTLVTCYPFYYVGSAPRRFIVRAVRAGAVANIR